MIQSTTSPAIPTRLPLGSIAVVAVLVVLAVLVGQTLEWATHPAPTGAFANCHTATPTGPHTFAGPPAFCINRTKNYSATISTTQGDIAIIFLTSSAPNTVNNFIVLAVNGYFNGQRFFEAADWYVQSGDPEGSGRGGPGYALADEPTTDQWVPGSLGMARLPGQSLSGSQFFITRADFPNGPPSTVYNHFATVVLGADKLSQLSTSDRILGITVKTV